MLKTSTTLSESRRAAYNALINTEVEKVYKRRDILLTEAAGFVVLPGLLDIFVSAVFEDNKRSSKILAHIVTQGNYFYVLYKSAFQKTIFYLCHGNTFFFYLYD